MFEGHHPLSIAKTRTSWTVLAIALMVVVAGCGTVAITVEEPAGAKIELVKKGKWFGCFGPDWGTGWSRVSSDVVNTGEPSEMELEAMNSWVESTLTYFPRQYRAFIDLSGITTYPTTPTSMVEVRYAREVIPAVHQDVVRLWYAGRTLEVLTHVPFDVLADVLYNLGDKFKGILSEIKPELQEMAAANFKTLMAAPQQPSPREVESWLKSFLTKEQLAQIVEWVEDGVTLRTVTWGPLGGEPKHENVPMLWRLIKGTIELVIRQPKVRSTHVDFFEDVILRGLIVKRVETKLVNVGLLKFYADIKTFDTTYYSDRVVPDMDLIQDIGIADIVRPSAEQELELQRFGMTRAERLDPKARAEAIRSGLPPVGLKSTKVTAIRSQLLGALLEKEMAFIVIWNNPDETDPVRFLTTVITTTPYGMARVWALRGNDELGSATAVFDKNTAPIGSLVSWVIRLVDQRSLLVKLDKPLAVIAFGRRRLDPWKSMPKKPVSYLKASEELEPAAK